MTKKTRTILFLICLFLFILIAPSAVFYSQGYRIDFDSKKITQTGGLFLKTAPKRVDVYLNGELKRKTDFFFGSILIEELLPKKYEVEIKKEGYLPWKKNLEIKEKQVTEARNIILVPENQNFTILGGGINNFYFSPDERKIILKEESEKGWSLKLYDIERNVKSHLIEEKEIGAQAKLGREVGGLSSKTEATLLNLKFSEDSKEIYLDIGLKEQEKRFSLKLDKLPAVLTEIKITEKPEDILISQSFNQDFYELDNSGNLFKNKENLTKKPFPVKTETEYQLNIFPDYIFLREGKVLYLFNPDLKSFEKFSESVDSLRLSPDNKKLAYFNNYEIWLLFLKDEIEQPQKKAGDQLFIVRFSEKIGEVFWWTNYYLLFTTGNKIKIAEIDDRDRINITELAEFKTPEIFWNKIYKKLFILSDGKLYSSGNLLP